MAGQVSKEELGSVLMQAMLAAKNLRPHYDRLVQLQRRLQQLGPGDDDADKIKKLASDILKVNFVGIEAGARMLTTCLELATEKGAHFPLTVAFATMPDEQLYDALLMQQIHAPPSTQLEAFSRVEAALYAVKLPQEYHLPRCIEHLVGVRPRPHLVSAEPSDEQVAAVTGHLAKTNPSDPAPAATGHLAKTNLSDPAPAATGHLAKTNLSNPAPAATGEPPQPAAKSTAVDLDKARDYLDRGCTVVGVAVMHIDIAVTVLSRFMDPKELASLSESTDSVAYTFEEEEGPIHHMTDSPDGSRL